MKISKNFSLEEFAVSASYPNLVEKVPLEFIQNVVNLVSNVLQPLCDALKAKCIITSAYRPDALNKAVGGSLTSDHRYARAADTNFYANGVKLTSYNVAKKAVELGLEFDQMILYPTFVHFGYRKKENRKQILYSNTYKGKRL